VSGEEVYLPGPKWCLYEAASLAKSFIDWDWKADPLQRGGGFVALSPDLQLPRSQV
jgi:hypothetical protein